MFPKASDKTFEEKLKTNHLGKTSTFGMPKKGDAHFAVSHYAGKNYGCQDLFLQLKRISYFASKLSNIFCKKKKKNHISQNNVWPEATNVLGSSLVWTLNIEYLLLFSAGRP